jgi:protein-disulfide isomerase
VNGVPQGEIVACIRNRAITLSDVDHDAGHALHDALEQVYRERTLVLYRMVSDDLLARQAQFQHVSVDQLLKDHVDVQVPTVSDTEATAFLKARSASGEADSQQAQEAATDPQRVRQAATYLTLKRRADRKREYVEGLFKSYGVKVALAAPPAAPAEEIRGAMTPAIGSATAPITLVVFSDYLCPYCRQLSHTLDALLARYPSQLRVVYRQFPIHPQAERLAEAALCAEDQGHFLAYHQLLFDRPSVSLDELAPLATQAGLDREAFTACLGSERNRPRIQDDLNEGRRLVIEGTPTLFLDGVRLQGSQSLEVLSARIDALRASRAPLAAAAAPAMR